MTATALFYFIEGLSVAFFVIMAAQNLWQIDNRLRRILGGILAYWALQHILSVVVSPAFLSTSRYMSHIVNAIDMTAEPTCCFLLVELCRPGWLTWKKVIWNELPFIGLGALSFFVESDWFYYLLIAFFFLYGIGVFVAILVNIPKYNRFLREHYSYDENVNLRWMYVVLCTFLILMFVYAICSVRDTHVGDNIYLIGSIVSWSFICYCIQRQESVLYELSVTKKEREEVPDESVANDNSDFDNAIRERFIIPQLYLKPQLKLGDMAQAIGTNRTYLSRYLNEVLKTNFHDYVNGLRLNHAVTLIEESDYGINAIASIAGFNSYSTFRRSFIAKFGQSPQEYRLSHKK